MPVRSLLFLLLLLAPLSAAAAQELPAPLDLEAAAARAVETAADVRTAELDLAAAERELARVEADPTTLRVPRLNAQHAVAAAQDDLRNARAVARDAAADAFEGVLEAEDTAAIAEAALAIARTEAEAARIRLEAGAATRSDVDRADDAVRSAERDLRDARQALELARDRLASRLAVAEVPALAETDAEPQVPGLEATVARLDENAALRAARRSVTVAEARLEAVDVAFTVPRSEIESARDALETAEVRAGDLEDSLRLAVRQAHNAVLAAEGRWASAREQVATAEEDLRVATVRFEAGSIAEVTLERARLDLLRRQADARVARHGLRDALRSLETTILGAST
jgi:outer membrane protein TolC